VQQTVGQTFLVSSKPPYNSHNYASSYIHSFIQYSVWRQVQSLLQNDSSA
jgi:hypothetical protein